MIVKYRNNLTFYRVMSRRDLDSHVFGGFASDGPVRFRAVD
jgi:hypothetical protein